jgi:hypothetical protein
LTDPFSDQPEAGGANSAAEIGAKLKAGTNCGSCIPELKRLIAERPVGTPPRHHGNRWPPFTRLRNIGSLKPTQQ